MLHLNCNDSVKEHFSEVGVWPVHGVYVLETVMLMWAAGDDIPKLGINQNYLTINRHYPQKSHSIQFYRKKHLLLVLASSIKF